MDETPRQRRLRKKRENWHVNKARYLANSPPARAKPGYYDRYFSNPANRHKIQVSRCKKAGVEWSISLVEFERLILMQCHYCGGNLNPTGSGLDRKDNARGYSPDNVLPCCGSCNRTRGDRLSVEEMEVAMRAVLQLRAGGSLPQPR